MFLNRMDLIIPFLTLAIYIFFIQSYKDKTLKLSITQGFIGFLPVIFWSLFTLYYYGSFFANSVIAKTNLGLPAVQLQIQGFSYLYHNFLHDPLTSIIIYSTLVYTIFSKNKTYKILGLGLFFYLIYLVNVGADYMYGRFLTVPFLISLCILSQSLSKLSIDKSKYIVMLTLPLLVFNIYHYIFRDYSIAPSHNLTDERVFYYRTTGLMPVLFKKNTPIHSHFVETQILFESSQNEPIILNNMGFNGFLMSKIYPQKYIVDALGLTDPFLAAHPMRYGYWRVGHFARNIPKQYMDSIKLDRNVITEQNDHEVLNQIWLISRMPLNTPHRLQAIIDHNTGRISQRAAQAFSYYPYRVDVSSYEKLKGNLWLKPNATEQPILYGADK